MTPQIKQRIDQIRRGEVPEEYKRTKAGVVPIEWEEVRIGEVLTQRKTLQCVSEDAPLLSFTIEEGVIDPADKKSNKRDFLIKDINTKKFALTEVGDIIYNPANLKFGAIHRNNLRRGVVSPIYGVFYGTQDSVFMGYLLHNQRFIDYAKVYTEGTVEKLKTLSADTFLKLKITLPSLPEQKKIAEILSAQDKLITLKEKLIEEKKRQKKYLMQQLLTGKKRLPGFSGEWETTTFGQIGMIASGGTPDTTKAIYWNGDIPWCTPTDITKSGKYINDTEKHITEEGLTNSSANLMPENSILMCSRASIGPRCINTKTMATNQGFKNLICDTNKVVIEYVYDLIGLCVPDLIKLASGSTFLELSKNDFSNYAIKIPSLNEQVAIAKILTKADNEIELLRKNIDQEKQKKKALMQLLLSGVVRVDV